MKIRLFVSSALILIGVLGVSGCAASDEAPIGGDVIVPVSVEANDLQGTTVELIVGQVLNINTGDLAVDSYSGEIADTAVAEFFEGNATKGSETNPGVEAVAVGTTEVTMTNEQGGIQPLEFTVIVTKK